MIIVTCMYVYLYVPMLIAEIFNITSVSNNPQGKKHIKNEDTPRCLLVSRLEQKSLQPFDT